MGEAKRRREEFYRQAPEHKLGDASCWCSPTATRAGERTLSNGADRNDVVTLMKELIARFEGQPEVGGSA